MIIYQAKQMCSKNLKMVEKLACIFVDKVLLLLLPTCISVAPGSSRIAVVCNCLDMDGATYLLLELSYFIVLKSLS